MNLKLLYQETKNQLPLQRWEHTLRVIDTAIQLAKPVDLNMEKVEAAALCHDYCKYWPDEELLSWMKKYDIPQEYFAYHKELWHGPVAAEVIRVKYSITDPDILNAIRYHTTGRPDMSIMEKVIYLADYIEPGRKYPIIEKVRELAKVNLDKAVLQAMSNTITFLISRNHKIFPLTFEARNDLLNQMKHQYSKEESF